MKLQGISKNLQGAFGEPAPELVTITIGFMNLNVVFVSHGKKILCGRKFWLSRARHGL